MSHDGARSVAATARAEGEERLVRAAQAGDAAAIDRILSELTPPLLRATRVLLGPAHPDIDDLVQDVLIAVFDALPSFRGDCTLRHFAIRIAARRATTMRRRSRSVLAWLQAFFRREQPFRTDAPDPGDETDADQRRRALRTLLGEIPEAQAETLIMRVALDYGVDEIAQATRVPLNTVRSRLRLAKEALRCRIEADARWADLWQLESEKEESS
jgi:RNA polymerase sigma factor (sigma-70 family)